MTAAGGVLARVDDPALVAVVSIASALDVEPTTGLSSTEAARRLEEHGPNELRATQATPTWRRVLAQFQSPLIYLLLGAVAVAFAAWLIEGREGWPVDAVVIAAVIVLNAALGFVQESKAADAVAALARMTTVTASVLRDGERGRIDSSALVPGDVLLLEEGDAVGADARLFAAATLQVAEASLTGESAAVLKQCDVLPTVAAIADRSNMVFKGTAVVGGTGRAIVTATGMHTQVGSIARMLDATSETATPLQREVARIGRMLSIAVLIIATIVIATVLLLSPIHSFADVVTVLLLGVSLAVAAVPEGLPAILSLVLALGVQRMAGRNAVVKNLSSVETLGSATVICSDKTGTLTRAQMTIQRIITASADSNVTGSGYVPQGEVRTTDAAPLDDRGRAEAIVMLSGGSLAGNASLRREGDGGWSIGGDPTEAAFLVAERKLGLHERREARFDRVAELPFSSDRKMMSTIERDGEHGGELIVVSKGAPDVLMARCTQLRVGAEVLPFDDQRRAQALRDVDSLVGDALRTIAVAYRPLEAGEPPTAGEALERDLIFVGTVGIVDPPREEAKVAIAEAHRAGVRVMMITGDHPGTAARIAAQLGIAPAGARALTGADLDALDAAGFADAVRNTSVYARVAPAHKLRIVAALQADGEIVAMTGDGVNDAPAIKAADIGVAMGVTGTEVTKEAARMILADDNFATIVAAVREGRAIFDNIRKFLRYLLSSNMGEVLTIFLGVLGAGVIGLGSAEGDELVLPLLATQLLWINLITDSGPALAMGLDPETEDVMARAPRGIGDRAIDGAMWRNVVAIGLVMSLVTLLTIDMQLPGGMIEGKHSLVEARTAGFTVLVLAQLFNAFSARSESESAFRGLFTNGWLLTAVGVSAVLQIAVVVFAPLNVAFGTAPLSAAQWLVCILMSSVVLWFAELMKWVRRVGVSHGAGEMSESKTSLRSADLS
ncbi:MAG: haloacid dehalogenase [Sphingomonas bacterium]|uniref:cation-translocating P-type ATPase n=1 Tax=Sphingomonas bacterium TaxID=1895847 RepID=UPI002601F0FD|nr:cation-translocating P-type ATPase [Sphingomonas bacterium]MDB5696118.1 haloacid dehalogenase [Sphingomonas bacterium]